MINVIISAMCIIVIPVSFIIFIFSIAEDIKFTKTIRYYYSDAVEDLKDDLSCFRSWYYSMECQHSELIYQVDSSLFKLIEVINDARDNGSDMSDVLDKLETIKSDLIEANDKAKKGSV